MNQWFSNYTPTGYEPSGYWFEVSVSVPYSVPGIVIGTLTWTTSGPGTQATGSEMELGTASSNPSNMSIIAMAHTNSGGAIVRTLQLGSVVVTPLSGTVTRLGGLATDTPFSGLAEGNLTIEL